MRRGPFIKSMLTLMVLGVVLAVAGYALGGSTTVYWENGRPQSLKREVTNLSVTEPLQFTELDVHTSVANVRVVAGNAFSIEAQYQTGTPGYELDGDVLRVFDDNSEYSRIVSGIGFYKSGSNQMTITVPRDVKLVHVNVRSDVGDVQLRNIAAAELQAISSTGKLEMWDVSADELTAYADVGSVFLNNVQAIEMDVKADVGGVNLSGVKATEAFSAVSSVGSVKGNADLAGDINIRSDVGSIDLTLSQPRSQYDVDAKADIGSVRISPTQANPSSAPNEMILRSGTGSVTVRFSD